LRLAVRLQAGQTGALGFVAPKAIQLALRVPGRPDLAITLLDAGPPAALANGLIVIPPNRDEAVVEFELIGEIDEKVRVEVFHPEAAEDVKPKVVEGFFDVARHQHGTATDRPPPAPRPTPKAQEWAEHIDDEGYRRVLERIAEQRHVNEAELQQLLGTSRRVRAFARHFDELVKLLPFEIEVRTVQGMKAYAKKD